MIEAIKRIGEYAIGGNLTEDTYLNGICLKIPEARTNKGNLFEQHVVFLNFNAQTQKIEIDFEKINAGGKDSGKDYLWMGNNPGRKEQIFLTTDSPIYLFTQALPNIMKKANGDFKKDIAQILNKFFHDGMVDPSKFELLNEQVIRLKNDLIKIQRDVMSLETKKDINEKIRELKSTCGKMDIECDLSSEGDLQKAKENVGSKCEELIDSNIEDRLVNKYRKDILKRSGKKGIKRESLLTNELLLCRGIKKDEVSIYTVKVDGDLLTKRQGYRDIVYYEKINCLFDAKNMRYKNNLTVKGICSICEKDESMTTSNATNLEFKFYNTDKIGFSSNLDGIFTKNYNICKDCYQYLRVAENFIADKLSTRIGGLDTYIIPHFIFKIDNLDLNKFSKYLKYSTNSIENLESLRDFHENIELFKECEANKNNFIINYIFYHGSQRNEFKISKLIKDVPPSRLDFIRSKEEEISNTVDDNYGGNERFKIDLNRIWYNIPIKGKEGNYSGFSRYLDILDAVFSNRIINYSFLINQITEVIRIVKFERKGYNIRTEQDFTDKIIQLNFLLLLFIKLKLLGGIDMSEKNNANIGEVGEGLLPKEILDYWSDIALYRNEQKKALFLLGYLIGEIGNSQSATGHKNKPILDKINFQGMGEEKLIQLSNDVFEKLKQYDLLKYNDNEDAYSILKSLFDNNIASWSQSNQENVFYTLSGYAFSNYLVRKRSQSKCFEELKRASEYIEKIKEDSIKTREMKEVLEKAKRLAEENKYYAAREILKSIDIK
jgi:CRISPR-associated protein Csh1